ncbi:hypothetical protein Cni_G14648 [Canna indica]|uniref:Essential protein Yae1 N-terminal domain-containing protein n=1 Tax=Canna indica TaxID=4628 RepID=A0AAQ3KCH3_9LILI|nr:hypothetical protein Cni_G14648 [Canna indica]
MPYSLFSSFFFSFFSIYPHPFSVFSLFFLLLLLHSRPNLSLLSADLPLFSCFFLLLIHRSVPLLPLLFFLFLSYFLLLLLYVGFNSFYEIAAGLEEQHLQAWDLPLQVLLDETLHQEGFKDGYKDGLVSGKEEGREVGLKMGFQIGEELGFYQGCVDVWNSLIQIDSTAFSFRLQKSIQQLGDLLRKYPLLDPENEHVQDVMDAIRLKFRIISANIGAKLEYKGYPKSSTQGMEDS